MTQKNYAEQLIEQAAYQDGHDYDAVVDTDMMRAAAAYIKKLDCCSRCGGDRPCYILCNNCDIAVIEEIRNDEQDRLERELKDANFWRERWCKENEARGRQNQEQFNRIKELEALAEQHCFQLNDDREALLRAEAIIRKLPKTADGVAVVPWMKVYGFDADGNVCEMVIGDSVPMCDDGDPQGEPFDEGDWFFGGASGVFATQAAALAAKAEEVI